MATATARHILVNTEKECADIKQQITDGADFAEVAKQYSTCPSGKKGGSLGEFSKGQMVKEFDQVVFNDALHVLHGPIKTDFGYHILEITSRSD